MGTHPIFESDFDCLTVSFEMLAQGRPRKTREFTGPTPHSVAIEERQASTRPRDYLIRERHRNEHQRQVAIDQKVAQEAFDLKNEWEKQTDRQIRRHNIQRKVA